MEITINHIIILIISTLTVNIIRYLMNNTLLYLNNKRQIDVVNNFSSYLTILSYYMEKSYEIIHKSDILVYSIDGLRLNEESEEKAVKEYTKLVLKFLGTKLTNVLIEDIYGDDETLIFNIVEYFTERYATDEIRESAMNSVMKNEEGEMSESLERIIGINNGK